MRIATIGRFLICVFVEGRLATFDGVLLQRREEIMGENGARVNGKTIADGDFAGREDSLDDELRSAASPFLHLFSVLVIVVAAYLLYSLFHA